MINNQSEKNFVLIFILGMLNAFGDFVSISALGYLINEEFGLGMSGLILGIPLVFGAVSSIISGIVADRTITSSLMAKSTLKMYAGFLLLIAISIVFLSDNIIALGIIICFKEIVYYSNRVIFNKFLPDIIDKRKMERRLGLFSMSDMFSKGIGLAIGPYLASHLGFEVFFIDAAIWAVAILIYTLVKVSRPLDDLPATISEAQPGILNFWSGIKAYVVTIKGPYFYMILFWIIFNLMWGAREVLGISIIKEVYGFDRIWVGSYTFCAEIGGAIAGAFLASNKFLNNKSLIYRMAIAVLIMCFAFSGVFILENLEIEKWPLISAIFAISLKLMEGFASTIAGVLCMKYLVFDLDSELRGKASAFISSIGIAFLALSKSSLGFVAEHSESPGLIYLSISLLAIFYLILLTRKKTRFVYSA